MIAAECCGDAPQRGLLRVVLRPETAREIAPVITSLALFAHDAPH